MVHYIEPSEEEIWVMHGEVGNKCSIMKNCVSVVLPGIFYVYIFYNLIPSIFFKKDGRSRKNQSMI